MSGNSGDIWSHKSVLDGGAKTVDGTKIFGYLTVPEKCRIGVCCHELGHLLFGFPDLYDTDKTSEGVGSFCLMGSGNWGGGGDTPVHPSAWCKANQGWASVTNVLQNGVQSIEDVKTSHKVFRLWKDGSPSTEYFLVENRQQTGFDACLPDPGLLIWHIDESQDGNTDENRYKVALVQADGKKNLERNVNRGDAGDPYPGSALNTAFNSGVHSQLKILHWARIPVSPSMASASIGSVMTATLNVKCAKKAKDSKEKDFKEKEKDFKEKENKEKEKDNKDTKEKEKEKEEEEKEKESKEHAKDKEKDFKEKEGKDFKEKEKDFKEKENKEKDNKDPKRKRRKRRKKKRRRKRARSTRRTKRRISRRRRRTSKRRRIRRKITRIPKRKRRKRRKKKRRRKRRRRTKRRRKRARSTPKRRTKTSKRRIGTFWVMPES